MEKVKVILFVLLLHSPIIFLASAVHWSFGAAMVPSLVLGTAAGFTVIKREPWVWLRIGAVPAGGTLPKTEAIVTGACEPVEENADQFIEV